jgi:hypothetical protein
LEAGSPLRYARPQEGRPGALGTHRGGTPSHCAHHGFTALELGTKAREPLRDERRCVFSILLIILIVVIVLALMGFFGFRTRA